MFKIFRNLFYLMRKPKDKTKKYEISFYKAKNKENDNYYIITDAGITSKLEELHSYYDFEIVSLQLRDHYSKSYIVIKCKESDSNKIFLDFCKYLNKFINNTEYNEKRGY